MATPEDYDFMSAESSTGKHATGQPFKMEKRPGHVMSIQEMTTLAHSPEILKWHRERSDLILEYSENEDVLTRVARACAIRILDSAAFPGLGDAVFGTQNDSLTREDVQELVDDAIQKINGIVRAAIFDEALRRLRVNMNTVVREVDGYRNARTEATLERIIGLVQHVIADSESLGSPAFKIYMLGIDYLVFAKAEQITWHANLRSEINSYLKNQLRTAITKTNTWAEQCRSSLMSAWRFPIREVGGRNVWNYVYDVLRNELGLFESLGIPEAVLYDRFRRDGWRPPPNRSPTGCNMCFWKNWLLDNDPPTLPRDEAVRRAGQLAAEANAYRDADMAWAWEFFEQDTRYSEIISAWQRVADR